MEFWLVTTDHHKDRLWFKDEDDFKAGMNIPPILTSTMSVNILSFILMSNHVHFVLSCSEDDAQIFINRFKKMYSQRFWKKYGTKELLLKNGTDIRELHLGDESLERAIAYVQMNCVAANICLSPSDYQWGTGNTYFRMQKPKGILVKDMSGRNLARIIRSEVRLPDAYLLTEEGFVDTGSYVQVNFVESLFRTPKRMNYFLQNSSKAKQLHEFPSFDDQTIVSGARSLCSSLFKQKNISCLDESQQAEIFKQIRYRFSADPGQIARISGISYEDVCRLLDSF